MTYKVDSPEAEEFIHHEEILETLEYARTNKDNRTLIEQLIEKAALCKGLTHREAAVLLECDQPDLIEHIFHLAKEIKQKFYGNRICTAVPLELLRQRLYLLPVSCQEQNDCPQETDTRRDPSGSDCLTGYGAQAPGTRSRRTSHPESDRIYSGIYPDDLRYQT